jgi:hypothetical protein
VPRHRFLTQTLSASLVILGLHAAIVQAASPKLPSPSLLVVKPGDLPGFSLAEQQTESTTSAQHVAKVFYEDPPKEVPVDVKRLKHEGFQLAAQERFEYPHTYAESDASVFTSAHGARAEYASDRQFLLSLGFGKGPSGRFGVPTVPGAIGLTLITPTSRLDDVLFTTGHCFLLIMDSFEGPTTDEQARRAPTAGAAKLLPRTKHACR